MKQKKSTIKFLKKAKKDAMPGRQKGSKGATPQMKFHKKPRHNNKKDSDDEMEDVESDSEKIINYKVPSGSKSSGKSSTKKHKDELKGLEEADPEFFNYLKKNDSSLLEFSGDESDGDEDDDENDNSDNEGEDMDEEDENDQNDESEDESTDEDVPVSKRGKQQKNKAKIEVTEELLDSIAKNTLNGSIPEMKKLLSIFRTACNPNGEDSLGDDSAGDSKQISRYMILSPEVYEHAMITCISTLSKAFKHHLELKDNATKQKLEYMAKHPKWKKMQLLVLSFFKSILHTLEGLSDHIQQSQVSIFLIESLESYVPFLAPLPRLTKGVIKVLLNIWSFIPTAEDEGVEETLNVRGHAFLRIRQISLTLPGAIAEECFRALYLKFARQCKNFSEMNATSVTFMAQCVAELYASDPAMAYQQSFLYIRQLALHLRTSFLKKTSETTRQITSWQFLNCLRLWTRVICSLPSESNGLGALAFPLAQVMFGVMSSATSIYFVPLKFHLVACLHQLAANCKLFIPTAAQLLEVLDCGDLTSKPTPSTELAPKLQYLVKLPTDSITRVAVRDAVVQEVIALLRQEVEIYRFHVGFPEYTYLTSRRLKAFAKGCKVSKWRDITKILTGQIEQYAAHVKKARVKLNKPPMAITEFEPLLSTGPTGTLVASQRLNKLLSGGKMNVASEINVSKATTTAAGAAGKKDNKNFLKANYELSKTMKKSDKNKKQQKNRRGGSDSDSESDGDDESEDEEDEEDSMEESDGGDEVSGSEEEGSEDDEEEEDEDDDEEEEDEEVPDNIDGFQDSVQELSWMD